MKKIFEKIKIDTNGEGYLIRVFRNNKQRGDLEFSLHHFDRSAFYPKGARGFIKLINTDNDYWRSIKSKIPPKLLQEIKELAAIEAL